jgi:molybdopterin/thiamine biosynthesis adenylyltransferase
MPVKVKYDIRMDEDRYDRQKIFRGWNQERVERAKVLVVGAGALGNEVVKNLALIGVKEIYLVDFDTVVNSNLNRCVFFMDEDARSKAYKVDAVAEKVEKLNSNCRVTPIKQWIEDVSNEIYKKVTLAISCVDNLLARLQLNLACYKNGIPLIDGGIKGSLGQVEVVVPPDTPCLECGIGKKDWENIWVSISCSTKTPWEAKIPYFPTIASIIAGIQTHEAIKIIHGIDSYRENKTWNERIGIPLAGKRLFYNGLNNNFLIYSTYRNEYCNVCSTVNKG